MTPTHSNTVHFLVTVVSFPPVLKFSTIDCTGTWEYARLLEWSSGTFWLGYRKGGLRFIMSQLGPSRTQSVNHNDELFVNSVNTIPGKSVEEDMSAVARSVLG
jgi:hypothetical protein